ncbi:MAG: hypothetical protein QM817_14545 [Archangium sp.]
MATRTLTLPSWVNVVLEGGGLELERAAVDYARLSKLLAGDWRQRALEVSTLITDVTTRELEVQEAEARLRRRAVNEPELASSLGLMKLVQQRRGVLTAQLQCTESDLCVALDRVREDAEEAAQLVRAWQQFGAERSAWTLVLSTMLAAAPIASYLVAKSLGGVTFDLGGILDSAASVLALLGSAAVGVVSRARINSWGWLRNASGEGASWTPTAIVFSVLLACLPLSQVAPAVAGALALAANAVHLVGTAIAWWRRS